MARNASKLKRRASTLPTGYQSTIINILLKLKNEIRKSNPKKFGAIFLPLRKLPSRVVNISFHKTLQILTFMKIYYLLQLTQPRRKSRLGRIRYRSLHNGFKKVWRDLVNRTINQFDNIRR
jgi:phospholipid N-methyltransferase